MRSASGRYGSWGGLTSALYVGRRSPFGARLRRDGRRYALAAGTRSRPPQRIDRRSRWLAATRSPTPCRLPLPSRQRARAGGRYVRRAARAVAVRGLAENTSKRPAFPRTRAAPRRRRPVARAAARSRRARLARALPSDSNTKRSTSPPNRVRARTSARRTAADSRGTRPAPAARSSRYRLDLGQNRRSWRRAPAIGPRRRSGSRRTRASTGPPPLRSLPTCRAARRRASPARHPSAN